MTNLASELKSDLESGTWTNMGSTPMIYLENVTPLNLSNTYVRIQNPARRFIQTISGSILTEIRSCDIYIEAPTETIINKLYADIENILTSITGKCYVFTNMSDLLLTPKTVGLKLSLRCLTRT